MTVDLTSATLLARLRRAREDRGLSQAAAAEAMGVARTTLIAIEAGERALRADELIALARLYGERLDALLRAEAPVRPLAAQFRLAISRQSEEDELRGAVAELQRLAEDYLELEQSHGSPLATHYPPPRQFPARVPDRDVARLADEERRRLGLGDGPLPHLRDVLEADVGIRVFAIDLPSRIGGMFAIDEVLGACIAINANHSWERQRWSLAHEYAHFLTRSDQPEITVWIQEYKRVPADERFADDFARYFLLPADGLRRRWHGLRDGEAPTVGDMLAEADRWGVSLQAFVLRLEQLRVIRSGSYDDLVARGLVVEEARNRLGLERRRPDTEAAGRRMRSIAAAAYVEGQLSEERFSRLTRLDRVPARRLAAGGASPTTD